MKKIMAVLLFAILSLGFAKAEVSATAEKVIFEGTLRFGEYHCLTGKRNFGYPLAPGEWKFLRVNAQSAISYEIYQKEKDGYVFISNCESLTSTVLR